MASKFTFVHLHDVRTHIQHGLVLIEFVGESEWMREKRFVYMWSIAQNDSVTRKSQSSGCLLFLLLWWTPPAIIIVCVTWNPGKPAGILLSFDNANCSLKMFTMRGTEKLQLKSGSLKNCVSYIISLCLNSLARTKCTSMVSIVSYFLKLINQNVVCLHNISNY